MTPSASSRRLAIIVLFFLPGIVSASWVTRTPSIRDVLGASTAEMGLILFGLSVGSMAGILGSGALVARYGPRRIIAIGAVGMVLSMPVVALGALVTQSVVVAVGLIAFGAGMGVAEVALNVEGAHLEAEAGRSLLPTLHGFFSLGTVAGALLGMLAEANHFSVVIHLVATGVLTALPAVWAVRRIPTSTERREERRATSAVDLSGPDAAEAEHSAAQGDSADPTPRGRVWSDPRLLAIGMIIFAMALAEGTASDWLPLVMVDGHGFSAAVGSSVFAVFAAAMTCGRFFGSPLVDRIGRPRALLVGGVLALTGILLVSFVDSQPVAAAAVLLWGIGTSIGFPVALSAAGDSPADAARRVAATATIGYVAFLVGPPMLGLLGQDFGLRPAILVPAAMLCLGIAAASWLQRRGGAASASDAGRAGGGLG